MHTKMSYYNFLNTHYILCSNTMQIIFSFVISLIIILFQGKIKFGRSDVARTFLLHNRNNKQLFHVTVFKKKRL